MKNISAKIDIACGSAFALLAVSTLIGQSSWNKYQVAALLVLLAGHALINGIRELGGK